MAEEAPDLSAIKQAAQETFKRKIAPDILVAAKRVFEEYGETDVEQEEVNEIIAEQPPPAEFPYGIIVIAILKDILDAFDFTGIGVVLTTFFSILMSVILFSWTWGKVSGAWWKKRLFKKLFARYIVAIIIEFVPWLKIIPTNTVFVYMSYRNESKLVQMFNVFLEKLHSMGYK